MTRKAAKVRRQAINCGIPSGISPAAELIASNFDLLTEILLHVPAKSLFRFKSVSKHWLSLISHSQFGSNHSRRNPRPSISGLYFYLHTGIHSVSLCGRRNLPSLSILEGLEEQSTTRILHSCNGLLLCCNGHSDGGIYRKQHFVCNLTTKKYTILPSSNVSESYSPFAYLAFDPSKSHRYKVLFFRYFSSFPCQVDIYCSLSASWKEVTIEQNHWGHGVFWNGAIHWFSRENSLVRFDVDTEEVSVMPNPQTPKILTREKTMYFGESGSYLILIQSYSHYPLGFRILELDKDYCGWIVKCRVNLRPLVAVFPEMKGRNFYPRSGFKVMHIAKGDKQRDFILVLATRGRIVSYDFKCKTWDVLRDLPEGEMNLFDLKPYAYPFYETLFPL